MEGCVIVVYEEGFEVHAPYRLAWVEEMKDTVPQWRRKWHPPDRTWNYPIAMFDLVLALCKKHFGHVHVSDLREAGHVDEHGEVVTSPLDAAYLLLTAHAPEAALRKLHAMTLGAVHPDAGGDHETAVAINNAWDVIRKARGFE